MTLKSLIKNTAKATAFLAGMMLMTTTLTSCDQVYDNDMEDCEPGVSLRFVYEYNMLRANAFPSEVDCITVLVFDSTGNYVKSLTETSDALMDLGYKMPVHLEPGSYHLVVYGGLTCEDAKFDFAPEWLQSRAGAGTVDDIKVTLPTDAEGVSQTMLHNIEERTGGLYFGTLDLSIDELEDFNGVNRRTETVYMMKNTNTISIMLEELGIPDQMDVNDYRFRIIDDNFVLDGTNAKITTENKKSYKPYYSNTILMGYVDPNYRDGTLAEEEEDRPVQVAMAEFSTSRLFEKHMQTARLVISTTKNQQDGQEKVLIDIPFITYLTAARTLGASWIKGDPEKGITPNQEYLDRESNWNLMFFLNQDRWINTVFRVNSWIVRVDDITLGY